MAYTAGDVLVRAVMSGASGLPADTIINDFAFQAPTPPSPTQLDAMFTAVDRVYNVDTPGGLRLAKFLGEGINRSATHELQAYSIVAGPLGSPIATEPWLGPGAPATVNSNLPTEVAAVLSFHASLTGVLEESGATRPRARRRGRLYFGPLTTDAVTIADDTPFLTTAFRTMLGAIGVRLRDEAITSAVPWCVWSRADSTLREVVAGWTDNAPDSQRRRGQKSTARSTWG